MKTNNNITLLDYIKKYQGILPKLQPYQEELIKWLEKTENKSSCEDDKFDSTRTLLMVKNRQHKLFEYPKEVYESCIDQGEVGRIKRLKEELKAKMILEKEYHAYLHYGILEEYEYHKSASISVLNEIGKIKYNQRYCVKKDNIIFIPDKERFGLYYELDNNAMALCSEPLYIHGIPIYFYTDKSDFIQKASQILEDKYKDSLQKVRFIIFK